MYRECSVPTWVESPNTAVAVVAVAVAVVVSLPQYLNDVFYSEPTNILLSPIDGSSQHPSEGPSKRSFTLRINTAVLL